MLGSVWNGYGKVLLVVEEKGVLGPQCSPKHNAFDSSLCGCDLTTSISSKGMQGQANEKIGESAQTDDLPRQPSKKYSTEADVSRNVRHVLEDSSGVDTDGLEQMTDGLENWCSPQKSHQRSQSTGCVLVRKAQTTPHSQATAPQVKGRWDLQGRRRWGFKRHPRQGVNVKSTWPGCEVELGTCHCLPYHVYLVHTRIPGWSSPTTERYPLWW